MLVLLACAGLTACASLEMQQQTQTEGRLTATTRSFNLLFMHLPRDPEAKALELIADAPVVDIRQQRLSTFPDLIWPFSWVNLFLGYSEATCTANYGLPPPGVVDPTVGTTP